MNAKEQNSNKEKTTGQNDESNSGSGSESDEENDEKESPGSSSSSGGDGSGENKDSPQDEEDDEEEQDEDDDDENGDAEEEEEEEKPPAVPRDDLKEDLLHADINYGCILSFYDKFGKFASLKEYPIKSLESHLLERDVLPKKWCDLHLILMKHLNMGKHAKKEKWLAYLERVRIYLN